MTDKQWSDLLDVITGQPVTRPAVGFIIDCPWLPGWCGLEIADYFSSETLWFEANRKAIETFPDVWFLPGFWSEFGMCTEPSAFGARCLFPRNEFPFAEKILDDPGQVSQLPHPDPATDGLLPFMLNRLRWARPRMEDMGHTIRFSVSRGPLNIATFLMGTTEFLTALKTDPQAMHALLRTITDFLKRWHALQRETFPTIDGMFMLDDVVGFLGEKDFLEFGFPYLKELYATDVTVKFFHNDAPCAKSVRHYPAVGINLFNPGIQSTLNELRELAGPSLTLLGNIPPRDVLAKGSPADVRAAVKKLLAETRDHSRLILSCGGGMPPGVSTENIRAFVEGGEGLIQTGSVAPNEIRPVQAGAPSTTAILELNSARMSEHVASETRKQPDTTPFRLDGEVALITGGGSGLGRAMAHCMAAAGARVVLTGRRSEILKQTAAEIGPQAGFVVHDVTKLDAAPELARAASGQFGEITILVNNAGIHFKKPALATTEEEFLEVLNTHVLAAHALTRAVLPGMIERNRGSILFVASMASLFGIPLVVAYSAAKSACIGMVRTLATEVSAHGIRVNAVAPGWIETEITRKAMQDDPARRQRILDRTPMRTFGAAEDVGWAAVYLCSPAAKFLTGVVLPVDGGVSIGF